MVGCGTVAHYESLPDESRPTAACPAPGGGTVTSAPRDPVQPFAATQTTFSVPTAAICCHRLLINSRAFEMYNASRNLGENSFRMRWQRPQGGASGGEGLCDLLGNWFCVVHLWVWQV